MLAGAHLVDEVAVGRYRFHDLLRAYAAECAVADESPADRTAAIRRVLTWYLHTADAADRVLMPARRHVPLDPPAPYCGPLVLSGYGDRQAEGATLNNIGSVYGELGRFDDALGCFRQALDVAVEIGDRFGEAIALQNLGEAYHYLLQHGKAARCFRQALQIARDNDDPQIEGLTLTNLGNACLATGQAAAAQVHYEQALAVRLRAGDQQGEAETRRKLGDLLHASGKTADAHQHWRQALAIFDHLGDPRAADLRDRLDGAPVQGAFNGR